MVVNNNEEKFRYMLDNMLEGIQMYDFNWRYIYVNDALVKQSPYSRGEMLGYTLMEKYPGIEQTDLFGIMKRCMDQRATEHFETEFVFPDGTKAYFELSINPIPEGISILSIDRTERKLAKELVVSNERRFRALIENSTDMITLSTLDGKVLYGSPSITKVFGYSLEEIQRTPAFNFIHPGDIQNFVENRNYILQTPGKSYQGQLRLLHKNGKWIWCDATLTNMLHEPGINALVSNFRDISERKEAEKQREFDKNNLNALINSTTDLMWSVDLDTKLITFNQPFCEIIRLVSGKEPAKGDDVFSVILSPERASHFKTLYARAFAGEAFTEIEYFEAPMEFWSEVSYYPIRKGDEVIGTACHSRDITERKKAEENLKQSEKRLKEAQEIAHLGSWTLDFATNIALWSEEACRIYGLSPKESKQTYSSWLSFIHPDDLNAVITATNESQKTFSDTVLNHRIILRDGTVKHIYTKSRFEFDLNGNPTGLYGIAHDVTEEKIAEDNLKQSEAYLTEAQQLAKLGSWNYDIKTDKLTWSKELFNIFGTDKETFIETHGSFVHLIDVEDREFALQTSKHTQKTGDPFTIEYHITTSKGEKRILREHGYGERDSNGKVYRLFGTAQDITEQVLSQKKIEESEKRYRQIVETSQEGIWQIDENNKTVFVNKRFCEIFGYSFNEMIDKTVFDLLDEEEKIIIKEKIKRRKRGISENFELAYISKSGKRIWANVSASPIMGDKGKDLGGLAMFTDITERKNSEIEKEKMTADLIQRNQDLEQFAYIISHNLRAPVANILGATNVLNDQGLSEEEKDVFRRGLNESVTGLDNIIRDLNHILEVKRGINEVKENVRFSLLVENIKNSIKNLIEDSHIELAYDFSEIDELWSLKNYLYSIFYNLISNSIKYRQQQVPCHIKIKSHKIKNKIELTFTDNGMGIDLEKRGGQVFSLYQRFHTNIESKGMGLFMVKTQVEMLGGKISIKSDVNKGTEFKIEFEI
ncbi:PAS domain-containing sensor histidine kinase [Mucilaginibacter sp.]|uniref:PAS domain-containing sensor histidine kinase n=1 Tax=Mucilaginibacter sp. TaxID=1882438 RepID=UPI00261DF81F|nr:PAS domain-containing sensor histidine kinase [Mucilaginibacter sp.]MDB5127672.1 hypothetical protein [Mucilaginibacter sp.]